ncbi:MAG: peptidoglycan editing factor PgeF [Humibacillus sp.]|nr:peptidoglycan editing factor PgeF [Humibacillus sp.]MDN5778623.1 peptidoglycan editing factor PgeF [Humibacillus sp.]
MFYWRSTVPPSVTPASAHGRTVELAFTGRSPGAGAAPYRGLNLGGHVGDDADMVEVNRTALAARLGLPRQRLLFVNQVHGDQVEIVSGPWTGLVPNADAMVTREAGLALAVLVADCVPVLLHDARAGVVAAVHAGRPGMVAEVVLRTVERMRDVGASEVSAVVGPAVCGRCYEVPAALVDEAAAVAPSSRARSWTGTPAIDVAAGVVEQLAGADVTVTWVPGCTREHHDLYSYRRDHVTGRFAGLVLLREASSP